MPCFSQDATDEINAYHPDHVLRQKMPLFYFGDVHKDDASPFQSLIPPIQLNSDQNDVNNNRLLTPEALLQSEKTSPVDEHAKDDPTTVRAYRQLFAKLRFLGKHPSRSRAGRSHSLS